MMRLDKHEAKRGCRVPDTGLKDDLAVAVEQRQLSLVYQPQVTADGGTLVAVEVLVRWNHPTRGQIPPTLFIPLAEENGLIGRIGDFVLRRACRDGLEWENLTLSVNVSPIQFQVDSFVDSVLCAVEDTGFPLKRLELEITEGAIFDDPTRAENALRRLRSHFIRIALDDFGTGHASLSYLRLLPWDKVKIDRSFVNDVDMARSAAIVHAIVALSRALGLKVTAEGVEDVEQQRFLRTAGCHYLQGYLFSRPVDATTITQMVKLGFAGYLKREAALLVSCVNKPAPLAAAPA